MPDYPIASYDGNQIGMPRWPASTLVPGICPAAGDPSTDTSAAPAGCSSCNKCSKGLLIGLVAVGVLIAISGGKR